MRANRTIGLLLAASFASAGGAAAQQLLSVGDAVERALAVHPEVVAAEARRVEAQRGLDEAEASRGPIASARLAGNRYSDPNLVSPIHSFDPRDFPPFERTLVQGSVDLRYTLYDAGVQRERRRQATEREGAAAAALAGPG
ncbi:MAG: TolC family protein [Acidobacteria bacterium]|nr:TolC family protein [Acidobacteriota bacterium]